MLIKHSADCPEIIANDGCHLRELLHPKNDPVELPYSLAIAHVDVGSSSYVHFLEQDEVYYIIEGRGRVFVGGDSAEVAAGDAVLIPGGKAQWIRNTGEQPLLFAAVVSPPWREEDDTRLDGPEED